MAPHPTTLKLATPVYVSQRKVQQEPCYLTLITAIYQQLQPQWPRFTAVNAAFRIRDATQNWVLGGVGGNPEAENAVVDDIVGVLSGIWNILNSRKTGISW